MTDKTAPGPLTLSIDIGGTGVKMMVLDGKGRPATERARVETPHPATPDAVLGAILGLLKGQGRFDRVSVGFPGVIIQGVAHTAPNLGTEAWAGFDVARALGKATRRPVRAINDADMQGLGAVEGKGVELLITLGTGVGAGLYLDGRLVPNLELGHHPFRKGKTYEQFLGNVVRKKVGAKKWRKRVDKAIAQLQPIFNYRVLYIGGGNAKHLHAEDMPDNVRLVDNTAGIMGGIALWRD